MRLHLTVSVDGPDADLFVAIREVTPDGREVTAASGSPIRLGWQRISMRNEGPERSTDLRAWHIHDSVLLLDQGGPVTLDVNIWPAAWIVSAGNRLVVEIAGADQKGSGDFRHPPRELYTPDGGEPVDNGAPRPALVTIHTGGTNSSHLVAPVHHASSAHSENNGKPPRVMSHPNSEACTPLAPSRTQPSPWLRLGGVWPWPARETSQVRARRRRSLFRPPKPRPAWRAAFPAVTDGIASWLLPAASPVQTGDVAIAMQASKRDLALRAGSYPLIASLESN